MRLSTIVFGELEFGAEKSQHSERNRACLATLVQRLPLVLVDDARHQIPVGLPTQSEPVDVSCLMAARLGNRDKGHVRNFTQARVPSVLKVAGHPSTSRVWST